jgi:hypothetical protein
MQRVGVISFTQRYDGVTLIVIAFFREIKIYGPAHDFAKSSCLKVYIVPGRNEQFVPIVAFSSQGLTTTYF